jgi:hypothetical protein
MTKTEAVLVCVAVVAGLGLGKLVTSAIDKATEKERELNLKVLKRSNQERIEENAEDEAEYKALVEYRELRERRGFDEQLKNPDGTFWYRYSDASDKEIIVFSGIGKWGYPPLNDKGTWYTEGRKLTTVDYNGNASTTPYTIVKNANDSTILIIGNKEYKLCNTNVANPCWNSKIKLDLELFDREMYNMGMD